MQLVFFVLVFISSGYYEINVEGVSARTDNIHLFPEIFHMQKIFSGFFVANNYHPENFINMPGVPARFHRHFLHSPLSAPFLRPLTEHVSSGRVKIIPKK